MASACVTIYMWDVYIFFLLLLKDLNYKCEEYGKSHFTKFNSLKSTIMILIKKILDLSKFFTYMMNLYNE